MRLFPRWLTVIAVTLAGWAAPPPLAQAASLDTIADRVFGQPDFISNDLNNGGLGPNSQYQPNGVALDPQGNLYVADTFNNRVLEYDAPLTDHTADRVFGQPNFITNTANNGGVSASGLHFPSGVALDAQGNLYVADKSNNRVLEYDAPLAGDRIADRVFGQPNFGVNFANLSGVLTPTAASLYSPLGVTLDLAGNLYVADSFNHRVLEYDAPLTANHIADRVFGQGGSFITAVSNKGGVTAASLQFPGAVTLDAQGRLYIADTFNNRVLEYNAPLTTDRLADTVFGQPDFLSNGPNRGSGLTPTADGLSHPAGVALDAHDNLYVADIANNRVLEFNAALTTDDTADLVFGQPNFTTLTINTGGVGGKPTAASLYNPAGLALDSQGNLYLVESGNSRALEYDLPVPHALPALAALAPDTVARGSAAFKLTVTGAGFVPSSTVRLNGSDRPTTFIKSTQLTAAISAADVAAGGLISVTVFTPSPGGGAASPLSLTLYTRASRDVTADVVQGQPNFTANSANNPLLLGAGGLRSPAGLAVDELSGRLFVADSGNNRVLSWPDLPTFANGQPADLVLGQPNLLASLANNGGRTAKSLNFPTDVAVDRQGNLYVADANNNRVLEYNAPLSSGMSASRVFGQGGNFTTAVANQGGVSANSLFFPASVAMDAAGDLYVADADNHRVLEYDSPRTTDQTADGVFGQHNFNQNNLNNGGPSAQSLNFPHGLALDQKGNLYVADAGNNRVLEYDAPLIGDHFADRVLGQGGSFTTTAANLGGISANSLSSPWDVALDSNTNLYVADNVNKRVLEYDAPLTGDVTADRVVGQAGSFTTNTPNQGGLSANSLNGPNSLVLDARNDLYVADLGNHRVLEYAWVVPVTRLALPVLLR